MILGQLLKPFTSCFPYLASLLAPARASKRRPKSVHLFDPKCQKPRLPIPPRFTQTSWLALPPCGHRRPVSCQQHAAWLADPASLPCQAAASKPCRRCGRPVDTRCCQAVVVCSTDTPAKCPAGQHTLMGPWCRQGEPPRLWGCEPPGGNCWMRFCSFFIIFLEPGMVANLHDHDENHLGYFGT